MSTQRLYRLTVVAWPTPDGRPFDMQDEGLWEGIADAFHNPSLDNPWPEWLGNITDWFDDPGGPWSPPGRAAKSGYWIESAGLVVPVVRRRHWQTRAAAERKAADLRHWGATVRVDPSDPITWSDS